MRVLRFIILGVPTMGAVMRVAAAIAAFPPMSNAWPPSVALAASAIEIRFIRRLRKNHHGVITSNTTKTSVTPLGWAPLPLINIVDAYLAVWVFLFAEGNTLTHAFSWIHSAVTAATLCAKILARSLKGLRSCRV